MAIIKAFKGLRPKKEIAHLVASKPYDVLNSEEAKLEAKDNDYSFLHIIKPEIDIPNGVDLYDKSVYLKAKENFEKFQEEEILVEDAEDYIYIYRQIMSGKAQVGIVACSSIDDYFKDIIKKHEFTRPDKEEDRIRHMKTISAHPGPVFMCYPKQEEIDQIVDAYISKNDAEYDFTASDGVQHTFWVVKDRTVIELLESIFNDHVPFTYIADGHHRAASAAKVGKEMRDSMESNGDESFNYFLTVLFPDDQIQIIDYNRVVKDLGGMSSEEFLKEIEKVFMTTKMSYSYKPDNPHEFGMYFNGDWYRLVPPADLYDENDPVDVLDISILSKNLLDPILGIKDQRTDKRIDFVGGIRGLQELERRVDSSEMAVAFAIYPVSVRQLMNIADAGQVMPPKSTWFEPKLRSGLIVHKF